MFIETGRRKPAPTALTAVVRVLLCAMAVVFGCAVPAAAAPASTLVAGSVAGYPSGQPLGKPDLSASRIAPPSPPPPVLSLSPSLCTGVPSNAAADPLAGALPFTCAWGNLLIDVRRLCSDVGAGLLFDAPISLLLSAHLDADTGAGCAIFRPLARSPLG